MAKRRMTGKPVYEIDLVAQRDRREKLKRDIIKSYNVNYIDSETLRMQEEEKRRLEEEQQLQEEEERKQQAALEIFNRLESEKAADEAQKQQEIQQAIQERESLIHEIDESIQERMGGLTDEEIRMLTENIE